MDATERSVITANLKNQFTTIRVKEALKLTWPDEELKKRDSTKHSAMFTAEEAALLAEADEEDHTEPPSWDNAEEEHEGLGEGEKKEITKRIQIEHHGSPPKKGYAATSASSSTANNENKWEMVSDLEMIPAEANDQSSRIRELENELRQLRDMIQAKTETDKEPSSVRKKANRNDEL